MIRFGMVRHSNNPTENGPSRRSELTAGVNLAEESVVPAHILILNQTFYPDVASTGQLMWDLARHLDARGHRVSVLTSRQFYGTDKLHDLAEERIGNIHITRLRGTAFGKGNILGRLSDFASFYAAAALSLVKMEQPDVILSLTSPPLVSSLPALLRAVCGGKPALVHHVMDLYPQAMSAHGMSKSTGLTYKACQWVSGFTLSQCDAVIALGHDMKKLLLDDFPGCTTADKIHVVQPWAEGSELSPLPREGNSLLAQHGLEKTFNLVYSGNLGLAHDVDTLIGGIRATQQDHTLKWVFIGGGKRSESLKKQAQEENWPNVRFLPFAPRSQLNESLNMADVHLVSQLPAFTGVVVPSKLYGIFAVGRPTVMVGPADCECSLAVSGHEAGAVVPNGDVDGLVAAVKRMRDDANYRSRCGMNGRSAFVRHYDRPVACGAIERICVEAARGQVSASVSSLEMAAGQRIGA